MPKPIFVVQKHYASHLHYDFRLSIKGVLKSWAIPKEPSKDPKIRRLAIQAGDHPLGYAKFHGVIKEGYGKGRVHIWDSGNYDLISRKADKIVVDIHGRKLKGKYVLIRFRPGRSWLFFRMKKGGR